jgi:hypothetical protein
MAGRCRKRASASVSSVVGAQGVAVVVGLKEVSCSLTADYLSHLSFMSWWVLHSYEQRLRYYEMVYHR